MTAEHGMNCPQSTPNASDHCTCGLCWRNMHDTEATMHAAWRKRAEEAEAHITTLERDLAQSRAESADRLRVIEEVAAVIGFKYPSECRDFLAKRVREKIEACETAGRALAAEAHHGRKCWIVTNSEYTVPGENVDALCDARAATDANEKALAWVNAAQEASNG